MLVVELQKRDGRQYVTRWRVKSKNQLPPEPVAGTAYPDEKKIPRDFYENYTHYFYEEGRLIRFTKK